MNNSLSLIGYSDILGVVLSLPLFDLEHLQVFFVKELFLPPICCFYVTPSVSLNRSTCSIFAILDSLLSSSNHLYVFLSFNTL